jgi:hypothetical protein
MPPEIIEAVAPFLAIISVGTMILVGMKMRLSAKVLREEYAELHERMDFAERMLSSGKPGKGLGEQASTPT